MKIMKMVIIKMIKIMTVMMMRMIKVMKMIKYGNDDERDNGYKESRVYWCNSEASE